MLAIREAVEQWAAAIAHVPSRLRTVAMILELVRIIEEVSQERRYGKFGVTFQVEDGRIVQWHEIHKGSNK